MPTKTRSLTNTGTCPYCEQNVKLGYQTRSVKIGRHGFKRPRHWQQQIGACLGFGLTPVEVGKDGLEIIIQMLTKAKDPINQAIANLENGTTTEVRTYRGICKNSDPLWMVRKKEAIESLKADIRAIDRDIQRIQNKINNWQAQPLPGDA